MKYYIIAGEASGDLHGSNLMKALYEEDANADIRFWGGDLMQKSGGTLVKHYKELAFMGFIEVIFNLKTILKYEIEKLHKDGVELQLGDNKVLTPEEMMSAIETPILDIYNINSSKGIVLDKFNKLSTIKGAKKFINEYKELQDRFENGTVKKDVFKAIIKNTLVYK